MPGGNVASEHDACALVAIARKDARPTRAVLELALHGMASLAHRSGLVDGEGDGAGVLTDIPRALWAHELERAGCDETAVELERFAVGHFFHADREDVATIVSILASRGVETLLVRDETTDESALGPRGRTEAPRFLQLALLAPRGAILGSRALYEAGVDIETATSAAVVIRHGLTAMEAIEMLFPPIVNEMKRMGPELQDAYVQARAAIGPLAQGPAGILVRVGDTCIFGVDALGLRPLWHVETDDEHVFASERGFVPLERYVSDPLPLAPGERVALRRDMGWRLLDQRAVRERFLAARRLRGVSMHGLRSHLTCGGPTESPLPHQGLVPLGPAKRWEIGTPPDEMDDVSV